MIVTHRWLKKGQQHVTFEYENGTPGIHAFVFGTPTTKDLTRMKAAATGNVLTSELHIVKPVPPPKVGTLFVCGHVCRCILSVAVCVCVS